MRRRTKIGLGIGVVAVLAVVGLSLARRGRPHGTEVQTTTVEKRDLTALVLANGKIQPRNKVDISANIPGQILNLAVREGDRVAKGDFLLQIDKAQYQASAASSAANMEALLHDRAAARATLEQARYDFAKAEKSWDEKLIPETEFRRARSGLEAAEASMSAAEQRVEQARAGLAGARDSLSKTTIRAPLDGVITALPVHEGEVAVIGTMNNPGTVLMTISDLGSIDADLAVDETDLPRLKVGQKVTLGIDAYPDAKFEGVVREIGSSPIRPGSEAATRTGTTTAEAIDFEVKVTLLAPPEGVRPGFSATAEIETGHASQVPAVPLQALVTRDKDEKDKAAGVEEGVWMVADGKAKFAPIKTGIAGQVEIEVVDGLAAGDTVITGPFRALRELKEGSAVRVAPTPPAESGTGAAAGA